MRVMRTSAILLENYMLNNSANKPCDQQATSPIAAIFE